MTIAKHCVVFMGDKIFPLKEWLLQQCYRHSSGHNKFIEAFLIFWYFCLTLRKIPKHNTAKNGKFSRTLCWATFAGANDCVNSVHIRSFLVHVFPHWDWIQTRKTLETETLHSVNGSLIPNDWFSPFLKNDGRPESS